MKCYLHCKSMVFFMILMIGVSAALFVSESSAKPTAKFPHGCKEVGYVFENSRVILRPMVIDSKQTLYFFYNKSYYEIYLKYQKPSHLTFSADHKTYIDGDRWTALAMDESEMQFTCSLVNGTRPMGQIDCARVLEVCQYPRAKFADSNMGIYWVIENSGLWRTIRKAIEVGILLRW